MLRPRHILKHILEREGIMGGVICTAAVLVLLAAAYYVAAIRRH